MPDPAAGAIPRGARVECVAVGVDRRMEARPRRQHRGERSMTDPTQHANGAASRTLRRLLAFGAASALVLAVLAPAIAASKAGVAQASKVKITRVHQTHMAKTSAPLDQGEGADPET